MTEGVCGIRDTRCTAFASVVTQQAGKSEGPGKAVCLNHRREREAECGHPITDVRGTPTYASSSVNNSEVGLGTLHLREANPFFLR